MTLNFIDKAYAVTADQVGYSIVVSEQYLTIAGLITRVIIWLMYGVAVLSFFFLVYAGILYITSGGNPEQAKKGQQTLIYVIIGIIIIVLSYAILRAANLLGQGVL